MLPRILAAKVGAIKPAIKPPKNREKASKKKKAKKSKRYT